MKFLLPLLILMAFPISGCVFSEVGGNRNYGKNGELQSREDKCSGYCLERSENGNCSVFSRDVSEICLDYFNNVEK